MRAGRLLLLALLKLVDTQEGGDNCIRADSCPTGVVSSQCMQGCDCNSTVVRCSQGYPVCLGTLTLTPYIGSNAVTLPSQSLVGICKGSIHHILIRDMKKLNKIEPGFFTPLAPVLEEIHIRNNQNLTTLDISLFEENFASVRILAVEHQPGLANVSFIKSANLSGLLELYLAFNNISVIPCGVFNYTRSLQKLDLQGNKIVYMDECRLSPLLYVNNYLHVGLMSNPLYCGCSVNPKPKTASANITMNILGESDVELYEVVCDVTSNTTTLTYKTLLEAMKILNRTHTDEGCKNPSVQTEPRAPKCACENTIKQESHEAPINSFLLKVENLLCETKLVAYLRGKSDELERMNCSKPGQVVSFLQKKSWKFWLAVTAIIIVTGVIPCLISTAKIVKKSDEKDDESINEEFLEYLLHPDDSKYHMRSNDSLCSPLACKRKESKNERKESKNERKQKKQSTDVNIKFNDVMKNDINGNIESEAGGSNETPFPETQYTFSTKSKAQSSFGKSAKANKRHNKKPSKKAASHSGNNNAAEKVITDGQERQTSVEHILKLSGSNLPRADKVDKTLIPNPSVVSQPHHTDDIQMHKPDSRAGNQASKNILVPDSLLLPARTNVQPKKSSSQKMVTENEIPLATIDSLGSLEDEVQRAISKHSMASKHRDLSNVQLSEVAGHDMASAADLYKSAVDLAFEQDSFESVDEKNLKF